MCITNSGNLYHGGEQSATLPSYTQGDTITCILDMDSRTLSFGKNDEVSSGSRVCVTLTRIEFYSEVV